MKNIAQFLIDSAHRRPEHPAVIFEGKEITYSGLNRRTDALAWGLREKGIKPGDVVVLMMPNSIDWITAYYAAAKVGAVILPVNFLYRTEELSHIFGDSGAVSFIGSPDYLTYASPLVRGSKVFRSYCEDGEI